MPKIKTLTLAMSAVSMMAGCVSTQTSQGVNGLKMEAVQRVTHSQNNPQAFYQLGRYYHGQTRYELALEAYRQALSLQPQYVDALTGMGVAHAMLGQYDDALRVLKAAASIDPFSVTAQNNLGYIYWLLNERDEAMRAYRQALKLDPMNARARDNMRLAMKDAANDQVEVAADSHPETAPHAPQAAASIAASQDVGPEVNELRAPAPAVPADPSGAQSEAINSAATVAGPNADSGLALNEVAPRVYELKRPVQEAERVASLPEPRSTASADKTVVRAAMTSPVSPAAADSAAYLKVMNGNGVIGMAHEVARHMAAQGYPSAGTGNQPGFNEAQTRIEYRPGQAEEARRLSRLLPVQAVLSEATALGGKVTMRLVLGKDIRHAPDTWDAGVKTSPTAGGYAGTPRVTNDLRLVVANGNGVKGIARKVAEYLAGHGYRTTRVHDLRPFNKVVTRIEYRKGYASQAIRLGGQLPGKVAYVESAGLRTEVRLVLGHDIKANMAAWSPRLEDVKLADTDAAARL
jgi:tetratricopeptide (TPR) repeat protein